MWIITLKAGLGLPKKAGRSLLIKKRYQFGYQETNVFGNIYLIILGKNMESGI
jgi:hypothetical protein